jgi:hypothetical protein
MAYPGFSSNRYSGSDLSDYTLDTVHKHGEFVLYRGRPRTGTRPHPPSVLLLMLRSEQNAIFHVHAKDTRIYEANSRVNGVLDTKPYGDEINRSWIFRTVGFGHGLEFWTDFISTLSMIGYDGVISIEHEDSLMSLEDGLEKAAAFLRQILIREKLREIWWA